MFYEYCLQLGMHLSRSFRCSNSASKKHVALLRCAMTNRLRWSRGMCSLSQSPTISTNSSSEEGRSSLAESSRDLAGDGGGIWTFNSVSMRTSASRLSTCSHWKNLNITKSWLDTWILKHCFHIAKRNIFEGEVTDKQKNFDTMNPSV